MIVSPSRQSEINAVRQRMARGFTLIELLVATTVLVVLIVLTVSLINGMTKAVQRGSAQLQRMAQAQRAFDLTRRTLGEATLRPYYDYVDNTGLLRPAPTGSNAAVIAGYIPSSYARMSELRFIAGPAVPITGTAVPTGSPNATSLGGVSPYTGATLVTHAMFFQVPAGRTNTVADTRLRTLLNTVGFYVEYGNNSDLAPTLRGTAPTGKRFRLMMLTEPTESFSVYDVTQVRTYTGTDWYTVPLKTAANVHLLAENIVAMVVRPKKYNATTTPPSWTYFAYPYDSVYNQVAAGTAGWTQSETQHELPPVVGLTLVALDAENAQRLEQATGGNSAQALHLANSARLFADPSDVKYSADLATLTMYLTAHHIDYRTFTTDVSVEGAKW